MTLRTALICFLMFSPTSSLVAQETGVPVPQTSAAEAVSKPNPDADGIYRFGHDGVSAPVVLYKPEPRYTKEARKMKVSGVTTLQLIVSAEGTSQDVQIVKSIADRVKPKQHDAALTLDERAMEA